jgi:hypothetical protein
MAGMVIVAWMVWMRVEVEGSIVVFEAVMVVEIVVVRVLVIVMGACELELVECG